MANAHRGEIEATLGGRRQILCLTLGALAELEHAYGGVDLIALAERFETGRITATDAIRIIGAGLRGGGTSMTDEDVAKLQIDGGAAGFLKLCAALRPLGNLLGSALGNITGSANGNIYQMGRIQPFAAGGIVNSPTLFPMMGGTGLMGEAGAEAIMPLARGRDGKLGVRGGGGGATNITINISTPDAASFKQSQGQVASMIARAVERGQRNL